jgi:hypothetical protein
MYSEVSTFRAITEYNSGRMILAAAAKEVAVPQSTVHRTQ